MKPVLIALLTVLCGMSTAAAAAEPSLLQAAAVGIDFIEELERIAQGVASGLFGFRQRILFVERIQALCDDLTLGQ